MIDATILASSPTEPNTGGSVRKGYIQRPERWTGQELMEASKPAVRKDLREAICILDASGKIRGMSSKARRALEYSMHQPIASGFFAHIHPKDLYRVMRDVSDIVSGYSESATWRLDLRTGRGSWRTFQAFFTPDRSHEDGAFLLKLEDHGEKVAVA